MAGEASTGRAVQAADGPGLLSLMLAGATAIEMVNRWAILLVSAYFISAVIAARYGRPLPAVGSPL